MDTDIVAAPLKKDQIGGIAGWIRAQLQIRETHRISTDQFEYIIVVVLAILRIKLKEHGFRANYGELVKGMRLGELVDFVVTFIDSRHQYEINIIGDPSHLHIR